MIAYYCNEAVLQLPDVYRLVDLSRQQLEVITEAGVELQFVIERAPLSKGSTLAAAVLESISERKRSVRGFELLSTTEREYPALMGTETRLHFVDKERGPLFHHEFRTVMEGTLLTYMGASRLVHAAACDAWMQGALHSLKGRVTR